MGKIHLRATNCALVGDKIYFVSREVNLIYTLNLNTYEIEIMENMPEEIFLHEDLYGNIVYSYGKLILVPLCAEKIWIYDFEVKRWAAVEFQSNERNIQYKFFGAAAYRNYVYMFGHYYPGIIRLDVNTNSLKRIELPVGVNGHSYENKDGYFNWDYVIKDKWLYTPMIQSNRVLKLDLDTENYELIALGNSNNQYAGIAWDGRYFWFPPRGNGVYVKWDGGKEIMEYRLPKGFEESQYYFSGCYLSEHKLVFAGLQEKTLEFDIDKPEKAEILKRTIDCYKKADDGTVVFQDTAGTVFIQKEHREEKSINCCLDDRECWTFLEKKILDAGGIETFGTFTESVFFSLESLMKHITLGRNNIVYGDSVGDTIYRILK